MKNVKKMKSKQGQNTAEYLILLVLLAVGSISMFSAFGKSFRQQLTNVIAALSGDSYRENIKVNEVGERANRNEGMQIRAQDEYKFGN